MSVQVEAITRIATMPRMTPARDDELTTTQAARVLGWSDTTLRDYPRAKLAYRTTGGGEKRAGRRYYRRADVERLAAELRGDGHQA